MMSQRKIEKRRSSSLLSPLVALLVFALATSLWAEEAVDVPDSAPERSAEDRAAPEGEEVVPSPFDGGRGDVQRDVEEPGFTEAPPDAVAEEAPDEVVDDEPDDAVDDATAEDSASEVEAAYLERGASSASAPVEASLVHQAQLGAHPAPRSWHIRLSGALTELLLRHESYDVVSADDQLTTGGVSLDGEWVFWQRVPLMVQVGYLGGEFGDPLFESLETSGRVDALRLGLLVGFRLWDAVTPYVRGGFIATWSKLSIEGLGEDIAVESFAPGWYAMAGFELSLPRRWLRRIIRTELFTIGLRFEAGYADLGEHDLAASRERGGLMEERQAALGALRLGGAAIDLGFFLSF
jgi:hypothetical protein